MATHEERFRALLAEWDIEPCTDPSEVDQDEHRVSLAARYGNVRGYGGFLAVFNFNEDGSFEDMGVWE